jgi:hypothetical protein
LKELNDLSIMIEQELLRARHHLHHPAYYKHIPDFHFQYKIGYSRLDGLILDVEGFMEVNEKEGFDGASLMAWIYIQYKE